MLWTHNTRNKVQAPAAEHDAEPFAIALSTAPNVPMRVETTSFALMDVVEQKIRTGGKLQLDSTYHYIYQNHSLSYENEL
jgi:hypothetical protein